jgi:hypothetical protein
MDACYVRGFADTEPGQVGQIDFWLLHALGPSVDLVCLDYRRFSENPSIVMPDINRTI